MSLSPGLSSKLLLSLLIVYASIVNPRAGEIRFTLSPDSCITAWEKSPPIQLKKKEDFETVNYTDDEWRAYISPSSALNLSRQCFKVGETVFFLRTFIEIPKAGQFKFLALYNGFISLSVDGKEVLSGSPSRFYTYGRSTTEVDLPAGRHKLLLKLGSDGKRCVGYLQLSGSQENTPMVTLPVKDTPSALLSALSLKPRNAFVDLAREKPSVLLGFKGGVPIIDGNLSATIKVLTEQGEVLSRKLHPKPIKALSPPISFAFESNNKTPYFLVQAEVVYNSTKLGTLSARIFTRQGLSLWRRKVERKLANSEHLPLARLRLEKLSILEREYSDYLSFPDRVMRELTELQKLLKGEPLPEKGLIEKAYISPQDGSVQPYFVFVPSSYDHKPRPCIVYLHGYAPWLDKINWQQIPEPLLDFAEKEGWFILAPFARSNTDFQAIGETDVIYTLELLKKDYRILEDRVFLLGYSMGGMGAFTIAVHYPHLWAGLIALSSRWDYYLWKSLEKSRVEHFKTFLLDMEFGEPVRENLLHIPVLLYHGEFDSLADPRQAKSAHHKLQELGYRSELRIVKGFSHWISDYALSELSPAQWLRDKRTPLYPDRIVFKTHTLRYNRAYWLEIEDFSEWGKPARIELIRKDRTITIRSENVSALTLSLPPELRRGDKLSITWNNARSEFEPAREISLGKARPEPRKKPTLCGPVKDAFNYPFLLVHGRNRSSKSLALRWAKEWNEFAKGYPPLRLDTELTRRDIERFNLIAFGTPSTNSLIARVNDKLPVRITDDSFVVGERKFPSRGGGLIFCYPNPLNPRKYLVIYSGVLYGEHLPINHKFDLIPDFIIFNNRKDYDSTNCWLCAGFFDMNWKLSPALTWFSDGKPRRKPGGPNLWMP